MSAVEPDLAHVHAMWAQDRASAALGIEVLDLGIDTAGARPLGHARTRMPVVETMVNGHDIAHGGYIFTFADSTFALACNATGSLTVAAGADITYVAAGRLGDVLIADARERITYGRSGITDVTVTRESDGAVIAEFRGRSRSLRT
ncbi:hydroxyphenylacetyl-CoA thioesterase PaaI [Ornithinimicrobium sp. Y1847]|uniref:hydroxyphenylacetyl-CoA thioesterase PaaI n=1 Tax=unclassified Ornithinimicrobium TaxID=2615080 RepID=UPI003B66E716